MGGPGSGNRQSRLPDEVKKLKGTLKKSRINPSAPTSIHVLVPVASEQLDELARQVWNQYKQEIDTLGVFTASDYSSFILLIETKVAYENLKNNPEADFKTLDKLVERLMRLHREFGLTPSSRPTVQKAPMGPATQPEDPDDEFLN